MRTRGVVLERHGAERPYAGSVPLGVQELELDPPGPGEVLVGVRAAGVCHSDLSVVDGSRPRSLPLVLGHEAAGEVLELGPGVADLAVGDQVVLAFVPACGGCGPCRSGRAALCEPGAAANGANRLLGGGRRWRWPAGAGRGDGDDAAGPGHHLGVSAFAEHVVVSTRSAVRVPAELDPEVAALFGCAVLTGVGAVVRSAQVRPGDRVAVVGFGGVGLAAVMGAALAGAVQVVAVDVVDHKRSLALEVGATHAVPGGVGMVEAVADVTGGGADVVVETVGSAAVLADAYAAVRRGGTCVTVGLPHPDQVLSIPAVSLVAQEKTLRGSYLGSCVPALDVPRFVDLHLAGRLPVERLLSGRLGLDEVPAALDLLASGEAVRQVVLPGRG